MRITILSRSPDSIIETIKSTINKYIFQRTGRRGPSAVQESLLKGLELLGIDYNLNPSKNEIRDTVCVLSGIEPLRWATREKRRGNIKKLIAGPNIVVAPDEANGILLDDTIDAVITPSGWVKDFYSSFKKGFDKKIRVWAAGVDTDYFKPSENNRKEVDFLVYIKSKNGRVTGSVLSELNRRKVSHSAIYYGDYEDKYYLKMLQKSRYLIYISESESQGIALHEAWSCDVPSLVWDRGYWKYKNYGWHGKTNAPYLTEDCGIRFTGEHDFSVKLSEFLEKSNTYKPREYIKNNFSLMKSAENYISLLGD